MPLWYAASVLVRVSWMVPFSPTSPPHAPAGAAASSTGMATSTPSSAIRRMAIPPLALAPAGHDADGHDEELDAAEQHSGSRIARLPSRQRDGRCVHGADRMPGTVIVGTHWGDEGKGRFTDYLAKESALVVRYQAG